MIKKLYQILVKFIDSIGKETVKVEECIDCKFCNAEKSAHIHAYMSESAIYYCHSCSYTFNINFKETTISEDEMGKRRSNKNKKWNKNNMSKQNVKKTPPAVTPPAVTPPKTTVSATNASDDTWEVKIDCVTACSKTPSKITVSFSTLAKDKIDTLMNEYKNIEWLAYLLGDLETYSVTDIFVPNQDISTARVDNVKCEEYNSLPVIGVIHSHHTMGTGFSKTDDDWINQNHNISLCIAHNGISGHVRFKTKCGAYMLVEATVKIKYESGLEKEKFIESVKEKLSKRIYTTTTWPNKTGYVNYGYDIYGGYGYDPDQDVIPSVPNTSGKPEVPNSYLTDEEMEEIEKQVDELDFEKELSLAEELELLEEVVKQEDAM